MATDFAEFRESAAILCRASSCPACMGRVAPWLHATDDLILCACERCGYRDLGDGGEYLEAPDAELWASLLKSHGAEIAAIKRLAVMDADGAPPCDERPLPAFWRDFRIGYAIGAAVAVGCLALWALVHWLGRR